LLTIRLRVIRAGDSRGWFFLARPRVSSYVHVASWANMSDYWDYFGKNNLKRNKEESKNAAYVIL
jgi:hypothetical protein